MDHIQIVTAMELETYADTRDSEAIIPELVWQLINASVVDLTECRIPYGDTVNQPGWDGLVETTTGYRQYVPQHKSFWEIGTGSHPQDKATRDFKKRTDGMLLADRQNAAYVFVTPRCAGSGGWPEPAQTKWKQDRTNLGWQRISILDGQHLADWLREFPALGRWLLKKMGNLKTITGLATPAEHWEHLQGLVNGGDASLFHKVFLVGRDQACEELHRLFRGDINQLLLVCESQQDGEDFVAAFLASLDENTRRLYSHQCLFVKDAEAWMSFANLRKSHVLVANPKIDLDSDEQLLMAARKHGHRVIIPVSGTWASGTASLIQLRSPSKSTLEIVLRECGFETAKARELASAGALNLSGLKRYLLGFGELPPYATWENARVLAQAGLVGMWQGASQADREAMERLLGKPYGEWIEIARAESLRPDTPLIQRNEKWKVVSRGEAWSALGPRITNEDLDRFQQTAVSVLGEKDPKFDLSPDEHYLASVHGKNFTYSAAIRDGLAESLALLGSRPSALASCTTGKAEAVAYAVVRGLLTGADWVTWASLNSHLPMLAEAAPDAFLHALENALIDPAKSPFHGVYAQETNGVGGWNYMSGLLWALETLAWHPNFLVRVMTILGDLASIDPGGSWSNRPHNSLNHIFLPWYPQTTAAIPLRTSAITALLREQPEVGWKTLLSLLPTGHGISTGSHKPSWRRFIPDDWKDVVSKDEYSQQVLAYAELAVSIAASDLPKLADLVDRLPDLPYPAHTRILDHLASDTVKALSEDKRLPIWESLVDLVAKHRKFADAQWAMHHTTVTKIEEVATMLAPRAPMLLYRRLFSERDFDLYEEKGSYDEQRRQLEVKRQGIVKEILADGSLAAVLEFMSQVESPQKVGFALGGLASLEIDLKLLPDYLRRTDKVEKAFISNFVWGRYQAQGWPWVDGHLEKTWSVEDKLALLTVLPFQPETWRRAEALPGDGVNHYWQNAPAYPWGLDADALVKAAENLISCGRFHVAIDCFYVLVQKNAAFPADMAIKALLDAAMSPEEARRLEQHHIQAVISWLQKNVSEESDELFRVEWTYLPLLDRIGHEDVGPKTLERRLASKPAFFCEVIAAVFRSDKDEQPKGAITDSQRDIARNAYRLLNAWSTIPGSGADGTFNPAAFSAWLSEVKQITSDSGHFRVAMSQLGQALSRSPADPDGLWINKTIAEALNAKDVAEMRSGFATGLFNSRGVYSPSGGQEELELAATYRSNAEALEQYGYHRFAESIRKVAEDYERQARRDGELDPFGD